MPRRCFAVGLTMLLVGATAMATSGVGNSSAAEGREIAWSSRVLSDAVTDGQFVVWDVQNSPRDQDIYAMNPADGVTFAVATGPTSQQVEGIDAGTVIWFDTDYSVPGAPSRLLAKALPSGDVIEVASQTRGSGAAISGKWVAYWGEDDSLRVRDIGTLDDPIVLQPPFGYGTSLTIGDGWVIWNQLVGATPEGSGSAMHWNLLAQKIGEAEPQVLDDGWGSGNAVTMAYNLVLYAPLAATPQQAQFLGEHVAALNLDTGQKTLYTTAPNCFAAPMDTDGSYAVGSCPSVPPATSYLWGLDLGTNSRFAISIADNSESGGPNYQYAGGTLVWIERHSDGWHLFSAQIRELLPSAPRSNPETTSPDWDYYSETGHYLAAGFRQFWQRSGGLPVFGFPITEEFTENDLTVQYLERQRFEYHPEFAGTPYETELGLLGSEIATTYGLLDSPPFVAVARNTASDPDCEYFAETQHTLCGNFRSYWHSHGLDFGDAGNSYRESLALFGYPISQPFTDPETRLVTQYFQRAVLEYHPDNAAPYQVLPALLGAEQLAGRGGW
jgi:hypothetical protein